MRASVYAASGQHQEARAELDSIEKLARETEINPDAGLVATVEAFLGNMDGAFERLAEVEALGAGWFLTHAYDPRMFKIFGSDPRYWQMIDRLEFPPLPHYHEYYEVDQEQRRRLRKTD